MSGPTVMVSSWAGGLAVFRGGSLCGSQNQGRSWSLWAKGLPAPSGVLIC